MRTPQTLNITGIMVVDKPTGYSSNYILQQVKHLFNVRKAGHTGSLDPLASGVLPICLGEATKLSSYLLDADKQYQVTCQLGKITDSGDADGQVIVEKPIPEFSEKDLRDCLDAFIGEQEQIPPMFSALKYQGQPLYKLARRGIKVKRKARKITIHAIELIKFDQNSFTMVVRSSKGTYIRTLVEDIAYRLGSGGHVTMLRRMAVAGFDLSDALTLEQLQAQQGKLDELLIPAQQALPDWPAIKVDETDRVALGHGQKIQISQPFKCEKVRLFAADGTFLGLGEMAPNGVIQPKRMFVLADRSQ